MKSKTMSFSRIFIINTVLILSLGLVSGQDKTDISFGIGMPDAIHIGARYWIGQSQIGGSIGWWPGVPNLFIFSYKYVASLGGDYYYHFGPTAKYSDLKPWYARAGLNCWLIAWENDTESILFLPVRIGRDVYFNSDTGFSLDAGAGVIITGSGEGYRRLGPSFGIRFFHRM